MSDTRAVRYEQEIPQVLAVLGSVHAELDKLGLPRALVHLVHLRASQLNGCAFCVRMHTREAREGGETSERLDRLVVWRHSGDFSAAEKAALAWTEALTRIDDERDYAALRQALRERFDETQISALTTQVAMINLWNRIQVSKH
ncbi:carboxymuconolactone decarboxylase family protein [Pseudomonas sp. No.21]|uniref:carboxymuconolactone decarboxylase family protein n=1 Tax=Pseudomonas TaxID=286 RepID=UPI000DA88C1F|nr:MULTISPECIES: carboxymuconolactone decarboxylase family protein [Pseudomonas]MDW3712422.1 carboxymuconolactone decarboxylase family protein [Pseudomonas sp. 2023EL-01195]PZE11174.1 carboxymuconolactone decarboxylase family protein [Pseudomonas sp. 57B-090624]GJN45891.1 alkyl hydroperoxide reductase AhpD [Pseudomonas tohonis]